MRDSAGTERAAPLFYISPAQINYQIPAGTATGEATIIVANSAGIFSAGTVQVSTVAPGLFAATSNGQGLAAAQVQRVRGTASSFEQTAYFDTTLGRFMPVPIDLNPATDQVYLVLYATGLRNRTDLSKVTVKIGGSTAQIAYAGAQPGFVGVDQINVLLPTNFSGRGEVDVNVTVDGKAANAVRVNIK